MPKSHIPHFLLFLQVLIKLIKPYTRIKIGFISGELNIEPSDVESLLVSCILDTTIYGRIDQVRAHFRADIVWCKNSINATYICSEQVKGVLELDKKPEGTARYSSLEQWNTQLSKLQRDIVNKML